MTGRGTSQVSTRALVLALALAGLLTGRRASAAMTVVRETEDGQLETEYHEGDRVRLEGVRGDGTALIFDVGTKQAVIVYDGAKAFFDVVKQVKKLRPALARMQKARAPAERATDDLRYFPLRESRTINGFSCDMYDELTNGVVTKELCFAPFGPAVGQEKDHAQMMTFAGEMLLAGLGQRPRTLPEPTSGKRPSGLPVWTQTINPDRSRGGVSQVESITFGALPATIFSVPADYTEIDRVPDVHRGDVPRRYDPGLLGPPSSPASGSLRGKLSAVIAVMLLIALTMGLLIHSTLVHAAAGIVMEEPRFINALAASLVVWVVWLPMEFLGVPLVVRVPVACLATFGGLKLAYQKSVARTIALFVVATIIELLLVVGFAFMRGAFLTK